MKFINNLNSLSEIEFVSIFGSVFEKSEWIANEAYKLKPFKDAEDLMNKMTNIYENLNYYIEKYVFFIIEHRKKANYYCALLHK